MVPLPTAAQLMCLDYDDLATGAGANNNTTLRCQYYLELPQTMEVVLDNFTKRRLLYQSESTKKIKKNEHRN
jgi:hypothetical protein